MPIDSLAGFAPKKIASFAKTLSTLDPSFAAASETSAPVAQILAHAALSGQDIKPIVAEIQTLSLARVSPLLAGSLEPRSSEASSAVDAATTLLQQAAPTLAATGPIHLQVLDRNPAFATPLSNPAWSLAAKPLSTLGPISIRGSLLGDASSKWLQIFGGGTASIPTASTIVVELVRSGVVVAVFSIATPASPTQSITILPGSLWVRATSIIPTAPAGAFAGMTIAGGTLTSDRPLSLSGNQIQMPVFATLRLEVQGGAAETAEGAIATVVTPPATFHLTFAALGLATLKPEAWSATLFDQPLHVGAGDGTSVLLPRLNALLLEGPATEQELAFAPASTGLIELSGRSKILQAGWVLGLSHQAPALLGEAANAGGCFCLLERGLDLAWPRPSAPQALGRLCLVATSSTLILEGAFHLLPHSTRPRSFALWTDSEAIDARRGKLTAVIGEKSSFFYAGGALGEVFDLGVDLEASLDRPVTANGERLRLDIKGGLLSLQRATDGALTLVALGFVPAAAPGGVLNTVPLHVPLALDNALLALSSPLLLLLTAPVAFEPDGNALCDKGSLLLGFEYEIRKLFLPDPYVEHLDNGRFAQLQTHQRGGLFASVIWSSPDHVSLRFADAETPHPATAPLSEAGNDLSSSSTPTHHDTTAGMHLPPGTHPAALKNVASLDGLAALNPALTTNPGFALLSGSAAKNASATIATSPSLTPSDVNGLWGRVLGSSDNYPASRLPGTGLLDVSTRASQLGVWVEALQFGKAQLYSIDGLSLRSPAILSPVFTLPTISWEPMYNMSDEPGATEKLRRPPGDGVLNSLAVLSATLSPVAPLQSLQTFLNETSGPAPAPFLAALTLPYGLTGTFIQGPLPGIVVPAPALNRPSFEIGTGPGAEILTGAIQLTLRPPETSALHPVFYGRTFSRTAGETVPSGALSYGQEVIGSSVSSIFDSRFNNPVPTLTNGVPDNFGVPVTRYDFSGTGSSLFSNWVHLDTTSSTDIIKVAFDVVHGRTAHEVIQAQSIIYPWGIKVVRTITIDRQNSGSVYRFDSGWLAASDGEFAFPNADFPRSATHSGIVTSLIHVKNIHEFGLPITTDGTLDKPPSGLTPITMQPLTFHANISIGVEHEVTHGGSSSMDLGGTSRTVIPCDGITGYLCTTALTHLSVGNYLRFAANLPSAPGGNINATFNLGHSQNLLRATKFTASAISDSGLTALVVAVHGIPKLPAAGAWTVAVKQATDPSPRALAAQVPVPVVQPNVSGGTPSEAHFADGADIFRLAVGSAKAPSTVYGFLQDTGTQKSFLAHPFVTNSASASATGLLQLADPPHLADVGALLGSSGLFPSLANALKLDGLDKIATAAGEQSLSLDRWFPTDANKNTVLIKNSFAVVDLVYRVNPDGPQTKMPDDWDHIDGHNIHIKLGQPGTPFSIDIYNTALRLFLPSVNKSTPCLWLEGGFHADAHSLPSFPNLNVVYDGPLKPITDFFTALVNIVGAIDPPSGGSKSNPPGLNVAFADGKLSVTDNFPLPQIPLGPGYIQDVSLDLGCTVDIPHLDVGFLVGIGSPDAPFHWIVDPLAGTGCIQAGVKEKKLAVLIQAGLGLGLAIDLGVASGGASIVIAFQLQIIGTDFQLLLLLTGQANVDVLGGVASASLTLTCGLGLNIELIPFPPTSATAIGVASVAIHLSICWVVSIDWSGSWQFEKQFSLPALP